MHSFDVAVSVFGVIFLAELPDKTALSALVLATKYRAAPVFFGAALALAIQSAVAVAAGSLFSLLPARPVHIGAGIVFLVSAVIMWLKREGEEESAEAAKRGPAAGAPFWKALAATFGVVFIAEWGDLTQLATAAFAAHERAPWLVFGAATLALWAVTAIAVVIGKHAGKMLSPEITRRAAAVLFAAIGVALEMGVI
jgi:putative Ca2+/H+ antiporter (TMEM165/GDT1 family)